MGFPPSVSLLVTAQYCRYRLICDCRYDKARQMKEEQDEYCAKALAGRWDGLAPKFPEDLQWEALVDVLRGRVKVCR